MPENKVNDRVMAFIEAAVDLDDAELSAAIIGILQTKPQLMVIMSLALKWQKVQNNLITQECPGGMC